MKRILFIMLIMLPQTALANAVQLPINNLFDAMREHNGDKLLQQFSKDAQLHRAEVDGTVSVADIEKFASSITKSTKYLDEHLLDIIVHQQANLASVWTPYAFYLDQKLSHCGVNSFQLIKQKGSWKIHYLIDNTHQGDCNVFINRYK